MPALAPVAVPVACPVEARALGATVRCGTVRVALDRDLPAGRTIRIYFERYLREDDSHPITSTVVSIEGGPGYSTTADRAGRFDLWRPVSATRDLVLVDLRGTGRSGALRCAAFSRSTRDYIARAGRCAAELGPARDLYATGRAVEDVELVLRALGATTIDLYGDSYGTYAAQAFALRHAQRLRTLTLDGAYPLPGTDPTFADLAAAVRRGLRLACARRVTCPARRLGVDPVALVTGFSARLRSRPILGSAPNGDGTVTRVSLDEVAFAQVVGATYYHYGVWRDLLAAIVAARRGDTAPILRLAAETVVVDAGGADRPTYSEAAFLAVICHDYPQPWDPATPLGGRAAEAAQLISTYPLGAFWPLSAAAWTGVEYQGVMACLRWPSPADGDTPEPVGAVYPRVPTLVLNGDLDTLTTSAQAGEVARRFPRSTFVEVANSIHVTALYDHDACASGIYQRFVKTRRVGETACARRIPELRLVPSFASRLGDVRPAWAVAGNEATARGRRLAAVAAATAADVIARWWVNYDTTGIGLRGGIWSYDGDDPVVFTLAGVELVPGVRVSGTVRWAYDGAVTAETAVTAGSTTGTVTMRWTLAQRAARARLDGVVDGRRLHAAMLAP